MCGLFGFIAQERTLLDLETFLHLGCENDPRGGDSVGIFIDKATEYGVDKNKLFTDFFQTSKLLESVKAVNIAVGHTRKASVGAIGLETAQPVVIRNASTKEVDFVLLHNGTITNHYELKKYLKDVPIHYTDSQIMAYCLYYKGTRMFNEYEGAGMFITIDYREDRKFPTVKFFKGGSKENTWSKVVEEERPLWILETDKGLWFSSLQKSLYLKAFNTKYQTEKLPVNKVFTYYKGKLVNTEEIDRSEKAQRKYVAYTTKTTFDEDGFDHINSTDTNRTQTVAKEIYTKNTNKIIKHTDAFPVMSIAGAANREKVEFIRGAYIKDGKPITGVEILSDYGLKPSIPVISTIHTTYYFYHGVLIYGKNVYEALIEFQHTMQIDETTMLKDYDNCVYEFAHSLKYDAQSHLCERCKDFEFSYANEEYFPLFSTTYPTLYDIKGGVIKTAEEKNYVDSNLAATHYKQACQEYDKLSREDYLNIFMQNL